MSFELFDSTGYDERVAALQRCATSMNRRREVLNTLSAIKDDEPVVRVDFDRVSVVVNKHGTPLPDVDRPKGFVHPALLDFPPGAVFGVKKIGKFTLPTGVCLIVGAGGVGKTPLAHSLAALDRAEYGVVRIGEPLGGYSFDLREGATSLATALLASDCVVLDSIKDLISEGSGGLMKSGIARSALSSLSPWSAIACALGATIMVPVNASTDAPDVIELLAEAARSNATTTLLRTSGDTWDMLSRSGEGLPRQRGSLKLSFASGRARLTDVGSSVAGEPGKLHAIGSFKNEDWNAAVRRSLLPDTEV